LMKKLSKSFEQISAKSAHEDLERMFGTYFRVAFYGSKFGDLDGKQFIYKETAWTKLHEISQRLQNFYSRCFGENNVVILKDSGEIDTSKLDGEKAHIQITFVEPYFHDYEETKKKTYFDRNYNIDKFVYCTPFTKDGRSHGDAKEQYKRKTFLQVANTFPYLKTRNHVINKWEEVLTPLESACEDIKRKTEDLLRQLNKSPKIDLKQLQINLQGAVMTSVNQGPMHLANVFLSEIMEDETQLEAHNNLRLAFKKFIFVCEKALKQNKKLIKSDQYDYHKEMEKNCTKMANSLRSLVRDRSVAYKINNLHRAQMSKEEIKCRE